MKKHLIYFVVLLGVLPALSSALEGPKEINQACIAEGCFDGDKPGFPIEITQSGSYQFSSNIHVDDMQTTAIEIEETVNDVSINLNGFAMQGVVSCTGNAPICTPSSIYANYAIKFTNSKNITIHNGSISGFKSCIDGTGADGFSATLHDLRISNCFFHGISMFVGGGKSVVRNVHSSNNGGYGITVSGDSPVTDSFAFNNGWEGIGNGVCKRNVLASNGDVINSGEETCDAQFEINMCNAAPCP